MSLYIREDLVNETEGYNYGGGEPYETWTDDVGKLFRSLQREYGRCTSKVYVDQPNGKTIAVGWTFEKRIRYEDADETYLQSAWITVQSGPDVKRVEHGAYVDIEKARRARNP